MAWKVTNIVVEFERKRQPAQYESAGARVVWSASEDVVVGDGQDPEAVTRDLLGKVKTLVLTELGLVKFGEPASAAAVAAARSAAADLPANAPTAVVEQKVVAAAAAVPAATPSGGKKPAKKDKEPVAAPAPAAPAPAETRQISSGAEDRVDPAQAAATGLGDAFGGEAAPAAAKSATVPAKAAETPIAAKPAPVASGFSAQDLHGFVSDLIAKKVIDGTFVRGRLAGFGVARMSDLKPEQVTSFKAELDGLQAAKKA